MSKSSKGADRERKAKAILEAQGYRVEQAPKVAGYFNGMVRSSRHDFWGCIDLIGVHASRPTLYVQVGGADVMRTKEREVVDFARSVSQDHNTVMVWGFVEGRRPEGQRFRVTCWNGLEWGECEDQVCVPEAAKVPRCKHCRGPAGACVCDHPVIAHQAESDLRALRGGA